MARSYAAGSVIALPRLSALSTARLLQELLSAAAVEKKLPAALAADQSELEETRKDLEIELSRRLLAETSEAPGVQAADRVEDNAFGAFFDWLSAWARLPQDQHPFAAEAAKIRSTVFPDGLSFLAIRPADEWQEAELRLALLDDQGFEPVITKLGGKPFLDEIKSAHQAYGAALGITAPRGPSEVVRLRETQNAALEAIRAYVLRVSAHVRKKDPATAALAERLLAPLVGWKERPAPAPSEASAPATPPITPTG